MNTPKPFRADLCVDPIEAVPFADYQRLNNAFVFLAQSGAQIAYSRDGDDCWLHWPYGEGEEGDSPRNQGGVYASPIEAIEAEMKKRGLYNAREHNAKGTLT